MIKECFIIKTQDNLQLKGIVKTVENPVAIMLFIHGMGEHIRRYEHVMDFYNAHITQASPLGYHRKKISGSICPPA